MEGAIDRLGCGPRANLKVAIRQVVRNQGRVPQTLHQLSSDSGIQRCHQSQPQAKRLNHQLYGRISILAHGDPCNAYRSIPQLIDAITEMGDQLIQSNVVLPHNENDNSKDTAPHEKVVSDPGSLEDSGVLSL